jgi:hypothetical protein
VKVKHKFIHKKPTKAIRGSVAFIIKVNGKDYGAYELYDKCDEYYDALYTLALEKKMLIRKLKGKGSKMKEITMEAKISKGVIANKDPEEVEAMIRESILYQACKKLDGYIDDIEDFDMKEDGGSFLVTSSLVLCETNEMETKLIMLATKLREIGLPSEGVEEILDIFGENTGGF